ncbi:MAG: RNA polymerase sigma factor [Acidobacteriota bacterium]|nr:RNA polymerase sigma factor [Acidobacteriota bacterium]
MGTNPISLPLPHGLRNRRCSPASATQLSATSRKVEPAAQRPGDTLLAPRKPEVAVLRITEPDAEQEALARLIRQCVAGDPHAWQQLVQAQHRRIYGICYRFTGSSFDSEDLTQEVFVKLYKSLGSYDLQKGSFNTWITTLTRNLLVDHFRRTRLERASDSLDATLDGEPDSPSRASQLADPGRTQEQTAANTQLRDQIQQALAQLSPELREAVILRDLDDMDYKEIAAVLKIPEGTVKSRISRGRAELARLLQRIEGQVI